VCRGQSATDGSAELAESGYMDMRWAEISLPRCAARTLTRSPQHFPDVLGEGTKHSLALPEHKKGRLSAPLPLSQTALAYLLWPEIGFRPEFLSRPIEDRFLLGAPRGIVHRLVAGVYAPFGPNAFDVIHCNRTDDGTDDECCYSNEHLSSFPWRTSLQQDYSAPEVSDRDRLAERQILQEGGHAVSALPAGRRRWHH